MVCVSRAPSPRQSAGSVPASTPAATTATSSCRPPFINPATSTPFSAIHGPRFESAPTWLIVAARTKPVKLITERAAAAIQGPRGSGAYGQAALRAEVATLAATPPGCRNNALNRAAFNLFQLVAGGEIAEAEVIAALRRACVANGLAKDDGWQRVHATIRSGRGAGLQHPRSGGAP